MLMLANLISQYVALSAAAACYSSVPNILVFFSADFVVVAVVVAVVVVANETLDLYQCLLSSLLQTFVTDFNVFPMNIRWAI